MNLSQCLAGAGVFLWATTAMAQTTRPSEVPQVTITAATKLLIFDWKPVPGATYYQLYVNVDGHSGYTRTGSPVAAPGTRAGYGISAHLQHWQDALFRLSACNAAGCRDSKSLFPRRHMLETIGYFKASNTDPRDLFGSGIALSGDGNTMAVNAIDEASNATGINGNQADNSLKESGAVYVFRKVSGNWRQEAYIKVPSGNHDYRDFGFSQFGSSLHSLGLTNDGNTLVIGAAENFEDPPGEADTYVRASNGTWSLQSRLTAPDAHTFDGFGDTVDISGDGNTLRVGDAGSGTGTNTVEGHAYLFVRSGPSWQFVQKLSANHAGFDCLESRISGDASTLVQYCYKADYSAAHLETFKRSGNAWNHVSNLDVASGIIQQPTLSYDGNALAFTRPIPVTSLFYTYKVNVYRWAGSSWAQEATFDPPAETSDGQSYWGFAMSFNSNGSFLAIAGSPNPPGPPGVSEEIATGPAGNQGAVIVYQRTAGASTPWAFRSQVLAPNTVTRTFGSAVALSATGATLAVGANEDPSKARGINGNQMDTSATDAGAVFLY